MGVMNEIKLNETTQCFHCNKKVKYKSFNGEIIAVSLRTVLIDTSVSDNTNEFITEKGTIIRGVISDKGKKAFMIHKCKNNLLAM